MNLTVEWAAGISMVLIGIGMGMFYALSARLDRLGEQLRATERDLARAQQAAAETFVRNDGFVGLRAELKAAIHDLRTEWMADTQRREVRMERSERDILDQLAAIRDSMARLSGDKKTRAGDV